MSTHTKIPSLCHYPMALKREITYWLPIVLLDLFVNGSVGTWLQEVLGIKSKENNLVFPGMTSNH